MPDRPVSLKPISLLLTLLAVLAVPHVARAHATGEDYIFFNFRADSIDGLFEIHLEDLRDKWGIDIDTSVSEEAMLAQVYATAAQVVSRRRQGFATRTSRGAADRASAPRSCPAHFVVH